MPGADCARAEAEDVCLRHTIGWKQTRFQPSRRCLKRDSCYGKAFDRLLRDSKALPATSEKRRACEARTRSTNPLSKSTIRGLMVLSSGPNQMKASPQTYRNLFEDYEASLYLRARKVERFLKDFDSGYIAARASRAVTTPHLNVLGIFGLGARELCHSRALAWFLRADGEHEQGTLFINALLRLVNLPPVSTENYHVLLEKPDRVDVAIYAVREFALFIENKVYAKEQERQFERLTDSLKRLSEAKRIPPGHRVAVFLTNDGRPACTMPAKTDPTIAIVNLRRDVVFRAFIDALSTLPVKSLLLEKFLEAYDSGLTTLT